MKRNIKPDTNKSQTEHPLVARLGAMQQRQREVDSANASRDKQPRSTVEECTKQDATNIKGHGNQVHVEVATTSHGLPLTSSGWGGRIRASVTRLMEIDGISMYPEINTKRTVKKRAKMATQAFNERVDQLEAATLTAHKEYWDRLRHVYTTSTVKKMRLTSAEPLRTQPRTDHEALNALAMAASSGARHVNEQVASTDFASTRVTKAKRTYSLLRSSDRASGEAADTERNPVRVHDPTVAQAVDKLTNKLMQLLFQLEAALDAAAGESLMAAAATIASEATEMGRCEEAALARITEIEERRVQVMQGLLEYAKRKEERRNNEEEKGRTAPEP